MKNCHKVSSVPTAVIVGFESLNQTIEKITEAVIIEWF